MYGLTGSDYAELLSSHVLPGLTAARLTEFLELGKTMESVAWTDGVLDRFRHSASD